MYGKASAVMREVKIVEDCLSANCLYDAGGWLDQPTWFFEIIRIRKEVEQQIKSRNK